MTNINPHDKFFKETFSVKENALDFLKATLPEDVKSNIDFSTLTLDNNSYIDEKLKESFSDIVYNCVYKGNIKIKISVLLEHKSYTVDYPHLQILKYKLEIWEQNIKQKVPLTPVIPIIVYHGEDKWKVKKVYEYFEGIDETLKRFIPEFEYLLTDLSRYSDDKILSVFSQTALEVAFLLMKNIFNDEKLEVEIREIFNRGKEYFREERGFKFLESALRYIFYSSEIEVDKVIKTVSEISSEGGKKAMTIAMQLEKKGEYKKAIETAKRMIINGISLDMVVRCTGLSKAEVTEIAKTVSVKKRKRV